jgi:hypothetical protein
LAMRTTSLPLHTSSRHPLTSCRLVSRALIGLSTRSFVNLVEAGEGSGGTMPQLHSPPWVERGRRDNLQQLSAESSSSGLPVGPMKLIPGPAHCFICFFADVAPGRLRSCWVDFPLPLRASVLHCSTVPWMNRFARSRLLPRLWWHILAPRIALAVPTPPALTGWPSRAHGGGRRGSQRAGLGRRARCRSLLTASSVARDCASQAKFSRDETGADCATSGRGRGMGEEEESGFGVWDH